MRKIDLKIISLSHSMAMTDNYAVVLGEKKGRRKLPIVIGAFEAQAIAIQLENMNPKRPLTHDLFVNSLEGFNIELEHIVISNLVEGVFFSTLVFNQNGNIVEVDSRTSDAVALAVKTNCPVYTYEFILNEAGIEFDEDDDLTEEFEEEPTIDDLSIEDLENLLQEAIEEENYEDAAKLRDEINNRKES